MVIYAMSARVDPDFTAVSHIQNIGDAGDAMGDAGYVNLTLCTIQL
jgi:hypothetical protein